jgi:hypothetical protein
LLTSSVGGGSGIPSAHPRKPASSTATRHPRPRADRLLTPWAGDPLAPGVSHSPFLSTKEATRRTQSRSGTMAVNRQQRCSLAHHRDNSNRSPLLSWQTGPEMVRWVFANVHATTAQPQCHGSAIESTTDSHPQREGWLAAPNDMAYAAQSGLPRNGLLRQNGSTTATAGHSFLRQRNRSPHPDTVNRERPRNEWIEVNVPALVDESAFALAQEQLQKNQHFSPRRTKRPSLLQGLLVCEQCGYAMYGRSGGKPQHRLYYCRCQGVDGYR